MKQFLSTLPRNILDCFKGRMIIWHAIVIILTFILVTSGFDWLYFASTGKPTLRSWMFPAAPIGGLVPIALPLILLTIGSIGRGAKTTLAGWAVGQAELIGSLVSTAYKAITGRVHPSHGVGADISNMFHFGFLRSGVFWGWPSSHTTIAFAMAVTLFQLFPKQRWQGYVAITYALYIGIGVSMTIHWFSDFLAGAIIGAAIGLWSGKTSCAVKFTRRKPFRWRSDGFPTHPFGHRNALSSRGSLGSDRLPLSLAGFGPTIVLSQREIAKAPGGIWVSIRWLVVSMASRRVCWRSLRYSAARLLCSCGEGVQTASRPTCALCADGRLSRLVARAYASTNPDI